MVETLDQVAKDHVRRYRWAGERLREAGCTTVIDVGCGCGYGSWILAKEYSLDVLGVDIEREAIKYAKDHWQNSGVSYIIDDMSRGPWYTDADACVAFEVIEHVDEAEKLLANMRSAARGLFISSPNESNYPFASTKPKGHVRHYTWKQFNQLLEPLKIEEHHGQRGSEGELCAVTDGKFMIVRGDWP